MDMCFTFIPFSFPLLQVPGETDRALGRNCLRSDLGSIIKQIFIECLLCSRHYGGTVGIQQGIRQSWPSTPSGLLREKNQFVRSYKARLNLRGPSPSPPLSPSCFVPGMVWLLPLSFVLDVLILWAKLTLEEF